MIDVKQAVASARQFLSELGDRLTYDLRVEEVEETEAGNWLVTLGFREDYFGPTRVYRVFEVDGETAHVRSMKLRTQPAP